MPCLFEDDGTMSPSVEEVVMEFSISFLRQYNAESYLGEAADSRGGLFLDRHNFCHVWSVGFGKKCSSEIAVLESISGSFIRFFISRNTGMARYPLELDAMPSNLSLVVKISNFKCCKLVITSPVPVPHTL